MVYVQCLELSTQELLAAAMMMIIMEGRKEASTGGPWETGTRLTEI